jgi:hypothetical protein
MCGGDEVRENLGTAEEIACKFLVFQLNYFLIISKCKEASVFIEIRPCFTFLHYTNAETPKLDHPVSRFHLILNSVQCVLPPPLPPTTSRPTAVCHSRHN